MKDPVTRYGNCLIHGMRYTPTYESWVRMKQRCNNPNSDQFKYYGGRGIRIDLKWENFLMFFKDIGERPAGMTLSRINNDGNYEPSNCEWANHQDQMWNRSNTQWFIVDGDRIPLAEAARRLEIWPNSIRQKLKKGWDRERIISFYKNNLTKG